MSSAATWQLEQGRGLWRRFDGTGVVCVDQLSQGLTEIQLDGRDLMGVCLLGLQIPGFPEPVPATWVLDQYVRRNDLIATYERPEPDHLRVQVYWRHVWEEAAREAEITGRVEGVHLIVSLQTNRLDLRPTFSVISEVPTGEALCLTGSEETLWHRMDVSTPDAQRRVAELGSAAAWLVRPPRSDQSIVLMTLPSDLVAVRLEPHESHWRYEFQLLDEHLEKGVIRRAQVAAWFVPRAADEFWGRKLFLQLLSAPPPLTT